MKKMKIRYSQPINSDTFDLGAQRGASGRALAEAIALTAEVCGQPLSSSAVDMLAGDLGDFDETAILAALSRCRIELQGRLTVPDILARIDDGRPDADEAWAIMPKSELASAVWTDEMVQAWGIALPLLDAGDIAGARLAFREFYVKAVLEARARREPARWTPSLGTDAASRESVLLDAVKKRRLSAAHVKQLLPFESALVIAEENMAQVKLKNLH